MRVLVDECIDWRILRDLVGIDAKTDGLVRNREWCVACAGRQHFDVFVTVDRNLSYQQNLGRYKIALVVLRARTNRLRDLRPLIPELIRILPSLSPGQLRIVE